MELKYPLTLTTLNRKGGSSCRCSSARSEKEKPDKDHRHCGARVVGDHPCIAGLRSGVEYFNSLGGEFFGLARDGKYLG